MTFEEISLAFQAVSSQHKEVKAGMQALASGVKELRCTRTGNVETMAHSQSNTVVDAFGFEPT